MKSVHSAKVNVNRWLSHLLLLAGALTRGENRKSGTTGILSVPVTMHAARCARAAVPIHHHCTVAPSMERPKVSLRQDT